MYRGGAGCVALRRGAPHDTPLDKQVNSVGRTSAGAAAVNRRPLCKQTQLRRRPAPAKSGTGRRRASQCWLVARERGSASPLACVRGDSQVLERNCVVERESCAAETRRYYRYCVCWCFASIFSKSFRSVAISRHYREPDTAAAKLMLAECDMSAYAARRISLRHAKRRRHVRWGSGVMLISVARSTLTGPDVQLSVATQSCIVLRCKLQSRRVPLLFLFFPQEVFNYTIMSAVHRVVFRAFT